MTQVVWPLFYLLNRYTKFDRVLIHKQVFSNITEFNAPVELAFSAKNLFVYGGDYETISESLYQTDWIAFRSNPVNISWDYSSKW